MSADEAGVAPRRVYVMYRKAWWRLSPEEWWHFVSARSTARGYVFPNENLIGQPRAVTQTEGDDGQPRYEPAEPSVWVKAIDTWGDAEWTRAVEELVAVGMNDPGREAMPWPAGRARRSVETPVYGIDAYGSGKPLPPVGPDAE